MAALDPTTGALVAGQPPDTLCASVSVGGRLVARAVYDAITGAKLESWVSSEPADSEVILASPLPDTSKPPIAG